MNLLLSWNLFVIAIFFVIMAYSYIIGTNKTVKTILSVYLSILAADALGNIFKMYILDSANFSKAMMVFVSGGEPSEILIIAKVLIFAIVVVLLTVKGAFEVRGEPEGSSLVTCGLFGFLNAGLIVSTLIKYVSGSSLVQDQVASSNVPQVVRSSEFLYNMVQYYDFWFAVPVVAIIIWSIVKEG